MLTILPCLDSDELAALRRQELSISRDEAAELGRSAVEAAKNGYYYWGSTKVNWNRAVQAAVAAKISIPPTAQLPMRQNLQFSDTKVQVANETTLGAARRLTLAGLRPLALNFANGVHPGGGFCSGARAQEETLCRSSALYLTLVGDPMYDAHRERELPDSTDWAIYSPDVPVFRTDQGMELEHPWLLSFLTCAAPYAPSVGQPRAGDLLHQRIHRVLAIARAYGYTTLVLGAWGCGAFGNDPARTARNFREALEAEFAGSFSEIVFAITNWSNKSRSLAVFCDVFS